MTTYISVVIFCRKPTENVGFEPTVPYGITGFQDQRLQPLGQLSKLHTKSARRGSNPRSSPWQGDVLPLYHSRIIVLVFQARVIYYTINFILSTLFLKVFEIFQNFINSLRKHRQERRFCTIRRQEYTEVL